MRTTLLLVVALPLLLSAIVVGLLATESGSGWLLRQATQLVSQGELQLELQRSEGRFVDHLTLHGLSVRQADMAIEIGRLELRWNPQALLDRRAHIQALLFDDVRVVPPPSDPTAEPTVPEIPDIVLPIVVQIDRLTLSRLTITPDITIERLALTARLDDSGPALSDIDFRGQGLDLRGRLAMAGRAPHALDGRLSLRVDEDLTGTDVGVVEAAAQLGGEALRPSFEIAATQPRPLRLQGDLRLDQLSPGFDLRGTWHALAWPLRGDPQVQLDAGQLSLTGTPEAYELTLDTALRGDDIPPSGLALRASGDLEGLRFSPLRIETLDGLIEARGDVTWAPALGWRADIALDGIDPGALRADFPGRIGGTVSIQGGLSAAGVLTLDARIADLAGDLRGQPRRVSGDLRLQDERLLARELAIASGENRILIDGVAEQRLDLRIGVSAPDLAALHPGLAGRLNGAGSVGGTRERPTVNAELTGEALRFEEHRVAMLELRADWQQQGGTASVRLDDAFLGGQAVSTLRLDLDGEPAAHRLDLQLDASEVAASLAARGGLQGTRWTGRLDRLQLAQDAIGEWRLEAPAALDLGAEQATVDRLCLAQDAQRLCAEGGWRASDGLALNGSLRALDIGRLTRPLPGEATVDGRLDGRLTLAGQPHNPELDVELLPGDGMIRFEQDEERFELAYSDARLAAQFRDDVGSAELRLGLGAGGQAQGRIDLGAMRDGDRTLSGTITASFPDLSLVAGFVPALEAVQGRLTADTRIDGTLSAPQLLGGLAIEDARARVPAAGIDLTDVTLAVRGDGQSPLTIDGALRSGNGNLQLEGTFDLTSNAVDLRMVGEDFEAVRLPEARVELSPDLQLDGQDPYRLTGVVRVPTAAIEIKELPPGSVAVSDDEIIIGDAGEQALERPASPVEVRVRVEFGDAVTFEGFGLKTGLTGALDARVVGSDTRVDGKIELRDAAYKAYGQVLTVERGRLLFAGPPEKPDLDLRAVRESRDGTVKAYLAMSGPLAEPRPRIYTEPAKPDGEALSYLLTGRGLDQASEGEGFDMAAAALSLGLAQGEPLLQDLSERFGIDELRIDAGDGGIEETSVVVGKYLNPDLYLGYSQGLFDPVGAVLLRLRLSEQLEVETKSGIEQSVDLFYRIEHD
jgi:translocation and assembly module TamB